MSTANIFTAAIGGQAGDGVKEATINLSRLLSKYGFELFLSVEYPSLIRGGHNYARVSFSPEKIYSDFTQLDVLAAFNQETVEKHRKEIKKGGIVFLDAEKTDLPGVIALPAGKLAKEAGYPPLMRSAVFLGALCWYFDLALQELNKIFTENFGAKAAPNIDLAAKGFAFAQEAKVNKKELPKTKKTNKEMADGNEAFAEGLVAAGLQNYFAYPMTPSSTILHHLAKKAKDYKIKVVQPENEIAVINMAIGSAYAGKRTAVASSGGGVALMLEGAAMAGIEEVPIVIADSQRAATSTGVPTRTGQGDLAFVRHLPGEYPRIVLAPGDADEAYLLGVEAMNLAWQFQTPVAVMLDKQLSESTMSVNFKKNKIKITSHKKAKLGSGYKRHAFSLDGISPLAFPGDKDTVVKTSSYEHDENGWITDDPVMTAKMCEKRFAKNKGIRKVMIQNKAMKIYGDKKAKNIVVFFGSNKGAVLEAIKLSKKPIKAIQIVWLEPFDENMFAKEVKGAKKIVCLENNFTGQLHTLIREKTGLNLAAERRYDSLPFMPQELAARFSKIF